MARGNSKIIKPQPQRKIINIEKNNSFSEENMSSDILVGRQPIYDAKLNVIAYELLFRSKQDLQSATFNDGDKATSQLILNAFLDIGLQNIVGDLPAFINLTRKFLLDSNAIPFNKEDVVLEILEDIAIDDELVASVESLYKKGYNIALDDYIFDSEHQKIMDFISIIKIDILPLDQDGIKQQINKLSGFKGKLLAEKIESQEEFEFCKSLGFDYYQGFFLSKPKIISGQRIPTNRLAIIEMMSKLYDDETSITDIEENILSDVTMSYRLLRYLNSSYFGLAKNIDSVHHALIILGLKNIRQWITVISMSGMSDKPSDIVTTSLIRAKMCELLAEELGEENINQFFTTGLFSNLPALLDMPIDKILETIPIVEPIKLALLNKTGAHGKILQICIDYEQAQWEKLASAEVELSNIKNCYLASITWANEITQQITA